MIKEPPKAFALTPEDRHGGSWARLRAELERRIADVQRELEIPGLAIEKTEYHRGRIAAYRALLALDKDSPPGA